LFHSEAGGLFGFNRTLTRAAGAELPTNTLLQAFLDAQLPDRIGMTFDEEMVGCSSPEPPRRNPDARATSPSLRAFRFRAKRPARHLQI
jgi:hypothetical protein